MVYRSEWPAAASTSTVQLCKFLLSALLLLSSTAFLACVPLCPVPSKFLFSLFCIVTRHLSQSQYSSSVFFLSKTNVYSHSCTVVNLKFQIITNYQRAAQKQQKYVSQICWDTTLQVRPQLPQCPTICSSSDPNDAQKLLTIGKSEFAALEDVWWMFGCLV